MSDVRAAIEILERELEKADVEADRAATSMEMQRVNHARAKAVYEVCVTVREEIATAIAILKVNP